MAQRSPSPSSDEVEKVDLNQLEKGSASNAGRQSDREDGKIIITDAECYDKTGFSFPTWKKWWTLTVIFVVQVSMNFNASVYGNAVTGIEKQFSISAQAARSGQAIFLIAYAFGSELWAPWSEELGRKPILQCSLFLVNVWQILAALSKNFGTLCVARFLGGLSSAGGSVTLGMVADMWEADDQQYAVAYVVFSSVGGSVVGPIVGGFVENSSLSWRWIFWLQLIFGGATQLLHLITVQETRTTIMMEKEAQRRRKAGEKNIWGPEEVKSFSEKFSVKEILTVWTRPFVMFVTEPIVLCLSLFSGFSDALIFTFLEAFQPVYKQWNFTIITTGLAFCAILIGYFIAYAYFIPFIHMDRKARRRNPDLQPESRLFGLLFSAPLLCAGLFGFAWTSTGPPLPWIASMVFVVCIGVANYAIYFGTIDYMVASYGPYSASATGGNALARDFLAGIAAWYATPMYSNIGPPDKALPYASTVLACLAFVVTVPIYVFYFYGPQIRARSKFAQELATQSKSNNGRRASTYPGKKTSVSR